MMGKIMRLNRKSRLTVGVTAPALIGVASLAQAIIQSLPDLTTRDL